MILEFSYTDIKNNDLYTKTKINYDNILFIAKTQKTLHIQSNILGPINIDMNSYDYEKLSGRIKEDGVLLKCLNFYRENFGFVYHNPKHTKILEYNEHYTKVPYSRDRLVSIDMKLVYEYKEKTKLYYFYFNENKEPVIY